MRDTERENEALRLIAKLGGSVVNDPNFIMNKIK